MQPTGIALIGYGAIGRVHAMAYRDLPFHYGLPADAIRIVGVQPEASPAAYLSLRDGRPRETYPAGPTICDGLAGGFGRVPLEIAGSLIDEVLLVPEWAVRLSVAWLAMHEQLLVEGSGAIAVAPLLTGQIALHGQKAAAVLTGRNIDSALLRQCLEEFGET